MPRIRTVKPEFFEDERIAMDLSRDQRLFYIGCWKEADDEGRFHASPRRLLAAIFPYDEDLNAKDIATWLTRLEETGRAILYEVSGERYVQLTKFTHHQRINRPSESRVPAPEGWISEHSVRPHGAGTEASTPPRARTGTGTGTGSGNGTGATSARARGAAGGNDGGWGLADEEILELTDWGETPAGRRRELLPEVMERRTATPEPSRTVKGAITWVLAAHAADPLPRTEHAAVHAKRGGETPAAGRRQHGRTETGAASAGEVAAAVFPGKLRGMVNGDADADAQGGPAP